MAAPTFLFFYPNYTPPLQQWQEKWQTIANFRLA
jgi:hypothetical protein